MDKQQWIDSTLNSLEGIIPAEPGEHLWTRIKEATNRQALFLVPGKKVWIAAASFILLMFLNGLILKIHLSHNTDNDKSTLKVIEQYQLNPTRLDLY